jgi:MFS transporter, FHS family, glucose/mannose:H+ symporter
MMGHTEKAGMPSFQKNNTQPPAIVMFCLHFGFVLTGIGTTLLGCILPVLSIDWHLNDSTSGFLLAAQFAGASCGALLVRSGLYATVVRGYLLMLAGALAIPLSHSHFAPILFFCFGLGMGSAMTATSMLVARIRSTTRAASLSLLNASWGFGAVICPALVTLWERHLSAISIFLAMVCAAAVSVFLLVLQHAYLSSIRDDNTGPQDLKSKLSLLVPLGLFAFLYVGVEATISSWMMTYVHRLHISNFFIAPIATSLFWIALLIGRAAAPAVLKYVSEARLLTVSISLVLLSNVLLLLSYTSAMSITSATLAGLMLAPVFPLCLARVLSITSRPSESKWVFAVSGLGGSVLPWMTGQVATFGGSLRTGLMVPLIASGFMLFLHLRTQSSHN